MSRLRQLPGIRKDHLILLNFVHDARGNIREPKTHLFRLVDPATIVGCSTGRVATIKLSGPDVVVTEAKHAQRIIGDPN